MSHSATPWTVAHKVPLSMGFPRQGCWSWLPFPSLGDLPDPGSTQPWASGECRGQVRHPAPSWDQLMRTNWVGSVAQPPDPGGGSWHLPLHLSFFPTQEATSPVRLVQPQRDQCRPWVLLQYPRGCGQHHGHLTGSAAPPAPG